MSYEDIDDINELLAAIDKDLEILDEYLLTFEEEERDLAEAEADERRIMLALEDGSEESLREVRAYFEPYAKDAA